MTEQRRLDTSVDLREGPGGAGMDVGLVCLLETEMVKYKKILVLGVFHKAVRKVTNDFTNDLNMASQMGFSIIINLIS